MRLARASESVIFAFQFSGKSNSWLMSYTKMTEKYWERIQSEYADDDTLMTGSNDEMYYRVGRFSLNCVLLGSMGLFGS